MSHAALARALDVDRRQVATWVSGEYTPVPLRRAEIAGAVNAKVEELWPDAMPLDADPDSSERETA